MGIAWSPTGGRDAAIPRRWLWPSIIIGLLGCQLAACAVILYFASSDASVAVEPDYYQKALAWDQQAAQRERNQVLGWKPTVAIDAVADALRRRSVTLRLDDANATPLDGATVHVTAFHHARSNQRIDAELRAAGGGRYAALLALNRDGIWELRFRVERGEDVFTFVEQQQVNSSWSPPR